MTLGLAFSAGLAITGCTGGGDSGGTDLPAIRLVSADSCAQTLREVKDAALPHVGAYGFERGPLSAVDDRAGAAEDTTGQAAAKPGAAPGTGPDKSAAEHSSTNTAEAGIDEPDIVKTDGRRIVTVHGMTLEVIDPATRRITGSVELPHEGPTYRGYRVTNLLISGDRVLVIIPSNGGIMPDPGVRDDAASAREEAPPPDAGEPGAAAPGSPGAVTPPTGPDTPVSSPSAGDPNPGTPVPGASDPTGPAPTPERIRGPELLIIDVAGTPRIVQKLSLDGSFVDARQVGSRAWLVTRSTPNLRFSYPDQNTSPSAATAQNRKIVERSTLADWLPRYRSEKGGTADTGQVPCGAVLRPTEFRGSAMLTVFPVNLESDDTLDLDDAVSVVGDGQTVYSNGSSLYVAEERYPTPGTDRSNQPRTELYKFALPRSGSGPARFAAGGSVAGELLNQYALSEYQDHLRVATTTSAVGRTSERSESAVTVLATKDRELTSVGTVGGLGRGERIFGVRFVGPVGYVVTYKQTDPLYTLDLSDATKPRLVGELKMPGYSAYLHPVGTDRLIGVGQDATDQGETRGTQVSLFDVSQPDKPKRLSVYRLPGAYSQAEFDPHAFLFNPDTGLLVLPITGRYAQPMPAEKDPARPSTTAPTKPVLVPSGALVLRLTGDTFTEVGTVRSPLAEKTGDQIQRSLTVGGTLWLLSQQGLIAADQQGVTHQTWVRFPTG